MRLHSALLTVAFAMPMLAPHVFAQQPFPAKVDSSVSADESTKIIALSAIMNADPERGMPLLEGILKGNGSSALKDRAMSILTQTKSPRAQQVLSDYAKSTADPDLQLRAIRYMGRTETKETRQQLAGMYPSVTDARVKQEIIRSLASSGESDALLGIAKSEKDQGLRTSAIRDLASSENTPAATVAAFYATATDAADKRVVISGLTGRGDAKTVIDLARKETDPSMKAYIVQRLSGMQKNKDAMDFMMELLK
jgi:hypothetical protein